jgi:hypothetical protein
MFWRDLFTGKFCLRPLYLPNLVGIIGQFGAGKSLYLLEIGLRLANLLRKKLIVNFPISLVEIKKFCYASDLVWFYQHGRIIQLNWNLGQGNYKLSDLFNYGSAVICFDEAGLFANSRNWRDHLYDRKFFEQLNQLRSKNIHLLLAFHFVDQIDKQLRLVIQHWIHCKARFNFKEGWNIPKIWSRSAFHYDAESFAIYQNQMAIATRRRRRRLTWRVEREFLAISSFTSEIVNLIISFKLLFKGSFSKDSNFKAGIFQPYTQMLFKCFRSDYVFARHSSGSLPGAFPINRGGNAIIAGRSLPNSSRVVQSTENFLDL